MAPTGWLPVRSTRPVSGRPESTLHTHVQNGAWLGTCPLEQASGRQVREYIAYKCLKKRGWVTCPLEEAGGRHKDAGADHCADNQ